jgi:predicted AlkP superfamily pyrophosphatase or phosphodiesterase
LLGRFAALLLLVALTGGRAALAAGDPVILISLDGLRADYLERGVSPTLSALAEDGVNQAIASVDSAIARLGAGLKARGLYARTNLVIVADHGMAAVPSSQVFYLDDLAPAASFRLVSGGAIAGVEPIAGQGEAAQHALLGAHGHFDCWRKSEIPARLHYGTHRRVPSIVCLASDGWVLTVHAKSHMPAGEHGYDPADPHMAALFVAHGPAFARGVVLRPFDNVDVYPLLTTVLGLKPEPNDGRLSDVEAALAR